MEFKNSFKERIHTKKIKNKLKDGHQVLSDIFTELNLQLKEYQLIFCVVHKRSNESGAEQEKWKEIHRRIEYTPTIRFDLKQYKGKYFDDIITNDIEFFRRPFIQKIDSNLPC